MPVGDPNGIGPEIAFRAAEYLVKENIASPIVIGPKWAIDHCYGRLGIEIPCEEWNAESSISRGTISYVTCDMNPAEAYKFGEVSAEAGRITIRELDIALELAKICKIPYIAAGPHTEQSVNDAGVVFSGYPSYLQEKNESGRRCYLMLIAEKYRIVHVTLHMSVRKAVENIEASRIFDAIKNTHHALKRLGIENPAIAVAGLNPHNGEAGLFGNEESVAIAPAIKQANDTGLRVSGPYSPDTILLAEEKFDAYIMMLHDQGHIPLKFRYGRNIAALTIGSEFNFSTVAHGSGLQIAGKGTADWLPYLNACRVVLGINE